MEPTASPRQPCHLRATSGHYLFAGDAPTLIDSAEGGRLGQPGDSRDVTWMEVGWVRMGHPGIG